MNIPLVDLSRQYAGIAEEVAAAMAGVIIRGDFILGQALSQFESEFAAFSGVEHCVGVGNGTDALELALRALDVQPGDEVILPANTFIATGLAVLRVGARVVLVDCDPDHFLMDPTLVSEKVTERTRAVIPVHLYGQMAPIDEIASAAGTIPIVEDGAQSQGAAQGGRPSGSVGVIGATSFYPAKNIGALGDGGAVLTNDANLAARIRKLRNWGSEIKYHHPEVGFNSRLDTLQAAVLRVKLTQLDRWNQERQKAADRYDQMLAGVIEVIRPRVLPGNRHVWHLYVVRVPQRDIVLDRLHEQGIGAGVHYPVPMHLHGATAGLGHGPGDFPVAERLAGEILSLPMFPGITVSEQEKVVRVLAETLHEG